MSGQRPLLAPTGTAAIGLEIAEETPDQRVNAALGSQLRNGESIELVQDAIDRAARLAAIPAGESPPNRRSPVTVVVISSDGEGDRTVESLEVKVPEDWGFPSLIRAGGRATWQAVAEANQ